MKKAIFFILLIVVLSIPTFFRVLKPGIFSTQDFHFFRLFEFDKCVQAWQIPCRWAPDAGLGYGEPLFNFYTQLPYAFGEIFHVIGFQFIDALKILFMLSLVGSGITMFLLARKLWGSDLAGIISAVFYVYAPYRAVDVWVRGILPEALSFVFFSLIILFFERILESGRKRDYLFFSLTLAVALLNHNLSLVLFLPFLVIWISYRIITLKKYKTIAGLALGVVGALALSGFYLLPVIFESKYIDIEKATTTGYFDFRAHFDTLYQTLISRFWGYGGSTWGPNDGLNLSVGIPQWTAAFLAVVLAVLTRKKRVAGKVLVIVLVGWFCLFLTHNRSAFIWEAVKPMKYIQFPWRFLGQAVFAFSLAAGAIAACLEKKRAAIVAVVLTAAVIGSTFMFFREDIWYNYKDANLITGAEWDRQRTASIGDYWPNLGHKIPDKPATGEFINYFPGWVGAVPKNGLIPAKGTHFTNTPVRAWGNVISLVGVLAFVFAFAKFRHE